MVGILYRFLLFNCLARPNFQGWTCSIQGNRVTISSIFFHWICYFTYLSRCMFPTKKIHPAGSGRPPVLLGKHQARSPRREGNAYRRKSKWSEKTQAWNEGLIFGFQQLGATTLDGRKSLDYPGMQQKGLQILRSTTFFHWCRSCFPSIVWYDPIWTLAGRCFWIRILLGSIIWIIPP